MRKMICCHVFRLRGLEEEAHVEKHTDTQLSECLPSVHDALSSKKYKEKKMGAG